VSDQIDISTVDDSEFRQHLNTEFTISCEGEDVPDIKLLLEDISDYPDHREEDERQKRKPFGLIFKCGSGMLEQGVYRLEHSELPPCELFISPYEGGDGWCRLEAIIN